MPRRLIEREAEGLWEPIVILPPWRRIDTPPMDHIVESGQRGTGCCCSTKSAGGTAIEDTPVMPSDDKRHHESDGPQNRHLSGLRPPIQGEQPIEQLHAGGDGDDHGHDAEDGVHIRTGTHGEEMMQPDHERQHANRQRSPAPWNDSQIAAFPRKWQSPRIICRRPAGSVCRLRGDPRPRSNSRIAWHCRRRHW